MYSSSTVRAQWLLAHSVYKNRAVMWAVVYICQYKTVSTLKLRVSESDGILLTLLIT